MSTEEEASTTIAKRKLSCTACFDALWFCYSPIHQLNQYYRLGSLDNCSGKWKALVHCLMLKTKPASQVELWTRYSFVREVVKQSKVLGELVFQLATPVNFASEDPENDMIKPAIKGVLNVLKACASAKEVKRVILTSSAAAVTINELKGTGLVMNESNWSDVEFLNTTKPPTWGYPASKALAEKATWKFAEENDIDLITLIPTLTTDPSLTPDIPSSVDLAMSLITGNDFLINAFKGMQLLSGSISIAHVEDVCRAHIFVAEKESASGRYICCAHNTSVPELAKFLSQRFPQYKIATEFDDCPTKAKLTISSEKLIKEGFTFKYGIEETFDQTVEYLKTKGALKN